MSNCDGWIRFQIVNPLFFFLNFFLFYDALFSIPHYCSRNVALGTFNVYLQYVPQIPDLGCLCLSLVVVLGSLPFLLLFSAMRIGKMLVSFTRIVNLQ